MQPTPSWAPRSVLSVLGLVVAAAAAVLVADRLTILLGLLTVSLFLSFALEAAVDTLARRGWRRGVAAAAVFAALGAMSVLFVALMVPLVVEQSEAFGRKAPQYAAQLSKHAGSLGLDLSEDDIVENLDVVAEYTPDLLSGIVAVGTAVLGFLGAVLAVGIFTFALVVRGPELRRTLCGFLPASVQDRVLQTWQVATELTGGYFLTRLVLATAAGVAYLVGFWLVGLPSPVALAFFMASVCFAIPVIGAYVGLAVPVFVGLLVGPETGIATALVILGYKQFEDFFLDPMLTRRTMRLHPAAAFTAMLAGSYLLGLLGVVFALPAAAIAQAIVSASVRQHDVVPSELTRIEGPGA